MSTIKPRRSVLYMPGINPRAMEKAKSLPADTLILDLEDAVAPDKKLEARQLVVDTLNAGGYGKRELVVRCNGLDTPWGEDDLAAIAGAPAHGVCLPKVESPHIVTRVAELLSAAGDDDKDIWAMAETPRGVQAIDSIAAAHGRLKVLLMGTSDLAKELRIPHTPDRGGFRYALSRCVIAARSAGLDIIDGVHLDLADDAGYAAVCHQGRELGFDGKSLIHPRQIDMANEVFGPDADEVARARAIIAAWDEASAAGKAVAVLDGKLIEVLHAEEARRTLAIAEAIRERQQ